MSISEILELEKEKLKLEHENEIQRIKLEMEKGQVGDSAWLEDTLSCSWDTVRDKVLLPFKNELSGRIIAYPERRGQPWRINKFKFKEWVNDNFHRIDWRPNTKKGA